MSLVLNVEILGEFKKLTAATKGAEGDLTGMGTKAQSISKSIGKAFAAIGIGLSFKMIANELQEATKAAIDDRKSQELLALAMINTGKATDANVASAEKAIAKMQLNAAVADDKLRPAYQKLFIATGDVTKSNELMQIALDTSASQGKDLDVVVQAMAKSLAGNDTALTKLIPSLRGSKDPINDLATAFKGASTEAANLDPYQKMQIIFGEIQEKLGTALLPILDDFAAWMSSAPGQKTLQEVADAAHDILVEMTNVVKFAMANKDWLGPMAAGIAVLFGAVTTINGVKTAIDAAKLAQIQFNTQVQKNPWVIGAVVATAAIPAVIDYSTNPKIQDDTLDILADRSRNALPNMTGSRSNVNITVNTPKITAKEITDLVNKAQKNGFTGQISIPRSR